MRSMTCEEWMVASQLYAFLGNSLLSPMSRTESVGLDSAFWRDLDGLLDGALAEPAESLASWAERASADAAVCDAAASDAEEIASFIREHPLVWVPRLREKVAASQPEGYFVRLLDVALALLKRQA